MDNMKYISVVLILISFNFLAIAQTGKIRGIVYDDESNETLVGVSIIIQGTVQ